MDNRIIGAFKPDSRVLPGFLGALQLQWRVIGALMLREAMARYGRENLGFFWLVGEPLLLSSGVMLIWSFAGGHNHGSIGMVPMALSGYATLTLQRHVVARAVHKLRNSTSLLFHRKIRLLDSLTASSILETICVLGSFLVAYVALYLFDVVLPIRDPLVLFGAWFLWAWVLFASALIIACLTEMVDWLEHFVAPTMYFALPISGSFFLLDWMPVKYRELLLLSPQVQANEMFRSAFFPPDIPFYWDGWYIFWWAVGLTAVGLFLVDHARLAIRYE